MSTSISLDCLKTLGIIKFSRENRRMNKKRGE